MLNNQLSNSGCFKFPTRNTYRVLCSKLKCFFGKKFEGGCGLKCLWEPCAHKPTLTICRFLVVVRSQCGGWRIPFRQCRNTVLEACLFVALYLQYLQYPQYNSILSNTEHPQYHNMHSIILSIHSIPAMEACLLPCIYSICSTIVSTVILSNHSIWSIAIRTVWYCSIHSFAAMHNWKLVCCRVSSQLHISDPHLCYAEKFTAATLCFTAFIAPAMQCSFCISVLLMQHFASHQCTTAAHCFTAFIALHQISVLIMQHRAGTLFWTMKVFFQGKAAHAGARLHSIYAFILSRALSLHHSI